MIVDDASSDSTPAIIQAYAARDQRIRVLRNACNEGLPNSLNNGFSAARGEYYTWISHDNEYYPHALRGMREVLESDPDVGLVHANFDFLYFNPDGSEQQLSRIQTCADSRGVLLLGFWAVGACFLYRSSLALRTEGYRDDWRIIEDYEYFLRLQLFGKFVHLDQSLYLYRSLRNEARLSVRHKKRQRRLTKQVVAQYFPWYMEAFQAEFGREVTAFICYHLSRRRRFRHFSENCKCLWKALRLMPSIVWKGAGKGRLWKTLMPRSVPLERRAPGDAAE